MNLDETSSYALSGEPVGYVLVSTSKNVYFMMVPSIALFLGARGQPRIKTPGANRYSVTTGPRASYPSRGPQLAFLFTDTCRPSQGEMP